MTRWNGGAPNVAGAQWFGSAAFGQPIATTIGRGPTIVARLTQSVTALGALIRRNASAGQGLATNVRCDVYDLANPVGPDTQQWVIALPAANAGATGGTLWVKKSGGVESAYDLNAWQNIDDVVTSSDPLTVGPDDQIVFKGVDPTAQGLYARFIASGAALYDGDTGAGGQTLAGKRISSVDVVYVLHNLSTRSVRVDGQLIIGGNAYSSSSGPVVRGATGFERMRFSFAENPATGLPWTNADALALTNGTNDFGILILNKFGAGDLSFRAAFLQFRTVTERRVATGHGQMFVGEEWVNIPLLNPANDTSAAWSKVAGHEYLFLYSTLSGSPMAEVSKVDTTGTYGLGSVPLTDAAVQGWTLDYGRVPLAQAADEDGQIATVMYVAGVASLDSLPYGSIIELSSLAAHKQRINTHSSQAYGSATILVGRGTGGQNAALNVSLINAGTLAVLSGPVAVQVSDVPADGKYHLVRVLFAAPVNLTAGTAVAISTSSASTVGWFLPALQTVLPTMGVDAVALDAANAGIGGSADLADATPARDFPWAILISPAAPTALASSVYALANRPALSYAGVGVVEQLPATIELAHLSWTATAIGNFDHYEIQRQDDGTWVDIAFVTTQASNYLYDPEGARTVAGVAHAYRMRTVDTDGGISAWANFPAVTITLDQCADVVVSSIADPASSLAFRDLTPTHSWDQRQTQRGKIVDILGRDMPVAFWPAEAGGESFTRKLAVAYADPAVVEGGAVTPDRAVFDAAIDFLQDRTLPYISYADAWGRTWLTSPAVQAPGPTREEPNGRYSITVLFSQVEDTPVPFVVSVPWHP